jgi:hypothetical protein
VPRSPYAGCLAADRNELLAFDGSQPAVKRGGSARVEHDRVGFQSGKVIDDCEYLQVRDSNKCPEGDLPTRDTHLRYLAPGLTVRSQGSEQRKCPKA